MSAQHWTEEDERRRQIEIARIPYHPPWPFVAFLGCECGAEEHLPGESHEGALACEAVYAGGKCSCGGYYDQESGEVVHDGLCDLAYPPDSTVYQLTELGAGRIVLGDLGLPLAGSRR